jgi:hypothetical protein
MDERPHLFRQELRRRPTLGELLPLLMTLVGAGVLLASFVWFIIWTESVKIPRI